MKRLFLLVFVTIMVTNYGNAQSFKVDTLQFNGSITSRINLVILGDGYTALQQNSFITDAKTLSAYVLSQAPWLNYASYFNVFAIRVISAETGTKHPNTATDCNSAYPAVPVANPDTYLGCTFDAYGIHRLVDPKNVINIVNVLSANFPSYDQVLIIANSPYYGGSGGDMAATSTIQSASREVTAHEMGHSFAYLADEYYAGDMYDAEKPNMTQQKDPALVKWKNWIGKVSVYQYCCGGNSALWYKPGNKTCKMELLNQPFCPVCSQKIVESIHTLVNPIAGYTPSTAVINTSEQFVLFKLTDVMKPTPNTLKIQWQLDAKDFAGNIDSVKIDQHKLSAGKHTLVVNVTDTTTLLRVDNHSAIHMSTVTWSINNAITGLKLSTTENKITCSVFPNPANGVLNISVDLDKKSMVSIDLVSIQGGIIQHIVNSLMNSGNYASVVNIESLPAGTYFVVFKIGNTVHTQPIIKN